MEEAKKHSENKVEGCASQVWLEQLILEDGSKKLMHTNDATAFAGRPMIAIMENYQTVDGKIRIPKVLQKYMGGKEIMG